MRYRKIDGAGIIGIIFAACVIFILVNFIYPDITYLKTENPAKTSFMEYREREWELNGKRQKIEQTWVPYSRISPYLIKAVLIAEDDKFWNHEGFDYDSIERAMIKNIKTRGFAAGGSTISQQLAKNLYLTPSKNPMRKLREAFLTIRIESTLPKRRILEIYLNVAEWGEGIFGIGAASRHYFGKRAAELDPYESARLAAVLPNPRRFDPLGDSSYVANRTRIIHSIMISRGIN
ncbi:MAG: monofunctional biosynthetic peptidoglycan transglycosylase [Nitrospirota bacterium]|nr:MAG: monofunctional biosynthetic peptidoglycan transglycosylase [Nitrospirota bacterium]